MMVASALVWISGSNKFRHSFKDFPLPTSLFLTKFLVKFIDKGIVLSILLLAPMSAFVRIVVDSR